MPTILVIDTSSIIHYLHYYKFDKLNSREVYNELNQFIYDRIISGEIRILDKVYEELSERPDTREFKQFIRTYQKNTIDLLPEVQSLIEKYKIPEIARNLSEIELDHEITKYENTFADLYLIAYCNKLKQEGYSPILINDESRNSDGKLIKKIPIICRSENIEYEKIPDLIFKVYKDELIFSLDTP